MRILSKHGQRRTIAWTFAGQSDSRGELIAIVATGLDITEQRSTQFQLTQAQSALLEAREVEARQAQQATGVAMENELRPFQQTPAEAADERRARPRRAYPYLQLVAPMSGEGIPPRDNFQQCLCHDIRPVDSHFIPISRSKRLS